MVEGERRGGGRDGGVAVDGRVYHSLSIPIICASKNRSIIKLDCFGEVGKAKIYIRMWGLSKGRQETVDWQHHCATPAATAGFLRRVSTCRGIQSGGSEPTSVG